jgi:hypothetical protein
MNDVRLNENGVGKYRSPGGVTAIVLGIGTVLYIIISAACAFYLLAQAFIQTKTSGTPIGAFETLAISALVAVIGTGLTAMAAVYSGTRQSATAYQVELLRSKTSEDLANFNAQLSRDLAEMKANSDEALARFKVSSDEGIAVFKSSSDEALSRLKANSDEALTRLKLSLDVKQVAYRELFGTSTVYFYTLRSVALGEWNEEGIKAAEALMVSAMQHIIYVDNDMRIKWFDFWQRAQQIYRNTSVEPDVTKRPGMVRTLIEQKVKFGRNEFDLRELHSRLEDVGKSAIASTMAK